MLRLLTILVVLATADLSALSQPAYEPAGRDLKVLAAARAASQTYQRKVDNIVAGLAKAETRVAAMRALADLRDPEVAVHLIPYLDWDIHDTTTVANACHALVELRAVQITDQLRIFTEKELEAGTHREKVRLASLNALAQLEKLGKPDYIRESDTDNANTRATGITDLGTIEDAEAAKILAKALLDDRRHIRRMAAIGLGKLGDSTFGHDLVVSLTDPDALVRRYASEALVRLDYKKAIPYILIAMDANRASGNLTWALTQLSGKDFGFDPHGTKIDRTETITEAFKWWTHNEKELTGQ